MLLVQGTGNMLTGDSELNGGGGGSSDEDGQVSSILAMSYENSKID